MVFMVGPKLISLLLCRHAWKDWATNEIHISSVFNSLKSESFPAVVPEMTLFIQFIGGRGEVDIDIVFTQGDDTQVTFKRSIPFPDPITTVDYLLQCKRVPIKRAGDYEIHIYANGEHIGNRSFHVH